MSFWTEKIKFGTLQVPRIMAAPLDGITDAPTRQLIRTFSPTELLFTEMRHVAAVVCDKRNESLRFKEVEQPLAFQFSANNLKFIPEAVEKALEKKIDMINLNVGCPARNVISSGGGSALMANIPVFKDIIKEFKTTINNRVPFTIKIRAGFKEKNAIEISKIAQDLGVDGIIIHPRTQPEGFTSRVDTALVKKLKEQVSIPIIFSGNINSFERAKKVYDETGVDGFMIGRALWGCPWKMREIADNSLDKKFEVTIDDMLSFALQHLKLTTEHYGLKNFYVVKKQLPLYIKNLENAAEIRKKIVAMRTYEELEDSLNKLLKNKNL